MALAGQSAAQGGHRCATPQHSTAQLQQQCCKWHQGVAAGIPLRPMPYATLPVGVQVPLFARKGPAAAALLNAQLARGQSPSSAPVMSGTPRYLQLRCVPHWRQSMDPRGPWGVTQSTVDCCPCVRCWRAGAQLWEVILHRLSAANQSTPVCHTCAGLSVATSCRRQLCWEAA